MASDVQTDFNALLCVLCQKDDQELLQTVTSTRDGENKLREAAEIRGGIVKNRIEIADNQGTRFYYHMTNECYKSYTHKNKLEAEKKRKKSEEDKNNEPDEVCMTPPSKSHRSSRQQTTPRAPPCAALKVNPQKLPCLICCKKSNKNCFDKFKISERNVALELFKTAKHLEDSVYDQIAILERLGKNHSVDWENTVSAVLAADLYAHHSCLRAYRKKCPKEDSEDTTAKKIPFKRVLFARALPYIDKMLKAKEIYSIKELRDFVISTTEEGETLDSEFRLRDIKKLLIENYGESITISASEKICESENVYSSSLTVAELAAKIKNTNIIRECAKILKSDFKKVDFGLQDRFPDGSTLRESWENTQMCDSWKTFVSEFYDIPKHNLFRNPQCVELDDAAIENDNPPSSTQNDLPRMDGFSIKMYSLFQQMKYILHGGKQQTPLTSMLPHSIYARDRSKTLITVLNHIGASKSYYEVKRDRDLLMAYAEKEAGDGNVPLPSHFTKDEGDFTMGAGDNSNHPDKLVAQFYICLNLNKLFSLLTGINILSTCSCFG